MPRGVERRDARRRRAIIRPEPPRSPYEAAVVEHKNLVWRLQLGLALCAITFSLGPLLVAASASGYGLVRVAMLTLAAVNFAWSFFLWRRVERGRHVVLRPREGEAPVAANDPRVIEIGAAFEALWPNNTPKPMVTFYTSQSTASTPAVHADARGVAVVVPDGFEELWYNSPITGRAMLAHEIGHILQDDVRLWTGLRHALPLAYFAAPAAWAQLVVGTVALTFVAFKPTSVNLLAQAAAFWVLAFAVASVRWVVVLGPRTLALSELMADHFAVIAVNRAGLLSALSELKDPPEGHHLPIEDRRAALAEGATPAWEAKGAPTGFSLRLLGAMLLLSGGIGYLHGVISESHLQNAIVATSEIRRREDGRYVWCLIQDGHCAVAWDPDARDFIPPEQASGVARHALAARLYRILRTGDETSVMPLLALTEAARLPEENKILMVLGAVTGGYHLGFTFGLLHPGDTQSWWAAGRHKDRDTWLELSSKLSSRKWRFQESPLDTPPWVDTWLYPLPKDLNNTRVTANCVALTFDATNLRGQERRDFGSEWLHAVDLKVTLTTSLTDLHCMGKPIEVPLLPEQLDVLLAVPDDVWRGGHVVVPREEVWWLLSVQAKRRWCDPIVREDLETFVQVLPPPERQNLRREFIRYWDVPAECAP